MTKKERKKPKLLNASRKKRIAKGSGTSVQEINKLIKAHRQMADMMKKMGKGGMKGMAKQLAGMGGMPGGMGGMPGGGLDPSAMLEDAKTGKGQGAEDVDFDAIEKALSGQAPMPPGMGLPGLGKKR